MPNDQKSTSFVRRISGFTGAPEVQTRRSKLGVAGGPRKVDVVFLMEKYGTRKTQVVEEVDEGEEELPPDPGFVIKFRLSSAYKALEKQEIEASVPLMKPYRVKKNRGSSKSVSVGEFTASPRNSFDEASLVNNPTGKSRLDQARQKLQQQSILKPSWNKLSQTKASTEVQIREREQRRKSSASFKSRDFSRYDNRGQIQTSPEVQIFKIDRDIKEGKGNKDGVKFIDEVGLSLAEKYRNRIEKDQKLLSRNYMPTTRVVRKLMKHGFGSNLLPDVATDSDSGDVTSSVCSSSRSAWSSSSSMSSDQVDSTLSNQKIGRIKYANSRSPSVLSAKLANEEEGSRKQKKVNRYLYQMCNCKRTGKPDTLNTLTRRKNNLSGVIQIYGCPKDLGDNHVVCPFCNIFPQSHIFAWLENIDSDEEPS